MDELSLRSLPFSMDSGGWMSAIITALAVGGDKLHWAFLHSGKEAVVLGPEQRAKAQAHAKADQYARDDQANLLAFTHCAAPAFLISRKSMHVAWPLARS